MEMRDKVRGHGAFSERTFTRSSVPQEPKMNEEFLTGKAPLQEFITTTQKYAQR